MGDDMSEPFDLQAVLKAQSVAPSGHRALLVSQREFSLIAFGLALYERKVRKDSRASKAKGFVPEPGHVDINAVRARQLAALIDRLGLKERRS